MSSSQKHLKTIGSIIAVAGVCVMLFAVWKWKTTPGGDIDAGDIPPVTARISAV